MPKPHNRLELTGQRFGRLMVVGYSHAKKHPGGSSHSMWRCQCDCGKETVVSGTYLRSKHTSSCGCALRDALIARNKTHGGAGTRTYRIWADMNARCTYHSVKQYPIYGGRGIAVCDRWKDFETFLADMGEAPDGHSIDRINNDGNYEPANCRWSDRATQMRNSSRTRHIEHQGKRLCITDWAADLGISARALSRRLQVMPLERAMTPGRFK